MEDAKRVLVVIDVGTDFSEELLEWIIEDFVLVKFCKLTLLRVMPWLSVACSPRTWPVMDPSLRNLKRLCLSYGVVPEITTTMGHPLKLAVADQINSINPTVVVFDNHHNRKNIDFYTNKIMCNMLVMNENGQVDLIRTRSSS